MKKNKARKRGPGDFNNNPFRSLKGFQPAAGPSAPARTRKTTPAGKETAEEEGALFLRAVDGVRAIRPSGNMTPAATVKKAEKPRAGDLDERRLFLQAIHEIGTTLRDEKDEQEGGASPRQSPSSRMRQLKRGTIRIREELDLHGLVKDEAIVKLSHFISAAYSRGQKAVLVITGKGINSPEGPVLQGAVAAWLRGKGRGFVAEFAPAPRDRGGSGAFVVFLRSASV